MADWFYARGDEQVGPVTQEKLRALIAAAQVKPDDLVWTEGMADWTPVAKVPALRVQPQAAQRAPGGAVAAANPATARPAAARTATRAAAVRPTSAPQAPAASPEQVEYFNPTRGMPPRAAALLAKHARPTGDAESWPLDDAQIAQFETAGKLRKKVMSAANLYRGLLFLTVVAGAIVLIVLAVTSFSGRGASGTVMMIGESVAGGFVIAFAVLYYFAWKATTRSQKWAPLTMFIIYVCSFALQLVSLGFANARDPGSAAGAIVGAIISAAFAVVSWKSYKAIPEYLKQPAWCQEILVRAGL